MPTDKPFKADATPHGDPFDRLYYKDSTGIFLRRDVTMTVHLRSSADCALRDACGISNPTPAGEHQPAGWALTASAASGPIVCAVVAGLGAAAVLQLTPLFRLLRLHMKLWSSSMPTSWLSAEARPT